MLPVQDVVRTGRAPLMTLALIGLNLIFFAADTGTRAPAPFAHIAAIPLLASMLFLWLFGDNVEARLGRLTMVLIYLAGGLIPGLGGAGAVTAVLGSYFVLLPQSRIFMVVPAPTWLVEVPAVVLLALWAVLHLLQFAGAPRTMWMFAFAFVVGALVARLRRPRAEWS